MANTVPPRSEIAKETTWNSESVFASIADVQAEMKALEASLSDLDAIRGHMGEGAAMVLKGFQTAEKITVRISKLYTYVGMEYSVDTANQQAGALYGQLIGLGGKVSAALSFLDPELLQIGKEKLVSWVNSEADLKIYGQYIEDLFRRQEHVRSAEVEEVLGMAGEVFGSADMIYEMLTNADMKFASAISSSQEPMDVTQSNIDALMDHPDRKVREGAWKHYYGTHLAFKNTLSSSLMTAVKRDVFYARSRGYKSSLDAALFPNNISTDVFHNLINTFKKHLPVWHRYFEIKKKALGHGDLYPYDVWAPLVKNPPVVDYKQSVEWIAKGLEPLGGDYVESLMTGCLVDRWVDIYPNQNKRQGAFSTGGVGTFPFIFMSYTDDLSSMSTLAHELGHSMHTYLTTKNQPLIYSNYSLFVAEVASNFNQAMTRAYLFKEKAGDKDFQIALITEAMYNFHRYFLQMPTLARFELEVHERAERGEGVTADDMIGLMADFLTEAYGPAMTIDRDMLGMMWGTFGHLYANFYVFQYATGISGAHALSQRILEGVPGAAESYVRDFLSAGNSDYPVNVLKKAGVDLSTPEPVERTFAVLSSMVDRLEQLVG
ncbi:MAG: oligoendopeptidase F [Anaerolineae bacterium]